MIRSITVYCSSSSALAPAYFEAGAAVGRALAENGWALVYGGNSVGLMKTVADAARAGGAVCRGANRSRSTATPGGGRGPAPPPPPPGASRSWGRSTQPAGERP